MFPSVFHLIGHEVSWQCCMDIRKSQMGPQGQNFFLYLSVNKLALRFFVIVIYVHTMWRLSKKYMLAYRCHVSYYLYASVLDFLRHPQPHTSCLASFLEKNTLIYLRIVADSPQLVRMSGFKLFSVPPMQTAVEEGQCMEIHSLVALAPRVAIEFVIQGTSKDCVDLFNTFLNSERKSLYQMLTTQHLMLA